MSYFRPTLLPNEKICFESREHWIIYLPTAFWIMASIAAYLLFSSIPMLSALIVTIAIISFFYAYIAYVFSVFMVTNMRVIMRVGLFKRKSLEVFLDKIESIAVDQSLFGGMMNFGAVTVIGTGGTQDSFPNIANPLVFRTQVQMQIEAKKDAP